MDFFGSCKFYLDCVSFTWIMRILLLLCSDYFDVMFFKFFLAFSDICHTFNQGRSGRGAGGHNAFGIFRDFNVSSESFRNFALGKDKDFEFYQKIFELGPPTLQVPQQLCCQQNLLSLVVVNLFQFVRPRVYLKWMGSVQSSR